MPLVGPLIPTEEQWQAMVDEIDKLDDEELEAMDEDADELEPIQAEKPPEQSDAEAKLAKIIGMNAEVSLLHHSHLMASEAAKERKKAWEAAAERLQATIRGFAEKYPLFDHPKADEKPSEPASGLPDASWRDTPIAKLIEYGLSESISEKIADSDILTIGDLSDLMGGSGDRPCLWPKGIGPAKSEAIEKALEKFWAANPVKDSANVTAAQHMAKIDAEANGQP